MGNASCSLIQRQAPLDLIFLLATVFSVNLVRILLSGTFASYFLSPKFRWTLRSSYNTLFSTAWNHMRYKSNKLDIHLAIPFQSKTT